MRNRTYSDIEEIKKKALPILRNSGVVRSSVFGSYAKGEATEESDIDFLIEFEGRKTLLDLAGLGIELEEALGKKVDVITYRSISPHLKDIILKEQVRIL